MDVGKKRMNAFLTPLPELKKLKGDKNSKKINENNENNEDNEKSNTLVNVETDYSDEDDLHLNSKMKNKGYVQGPVDPFFGQRRAFPITIEASNVDLNKIPENVNEYLAQVRAEAGGFRDLKRIDDYEDSDLDASEYVFYKKPESTESKDTKDNDDEFIIPMSDLEDFVYQYKAQREEYKDFRSSLHELDAIELPKTAKEWKKFIWEVSCEKEYIAQIIEEEEHIKLLVYLGKWLGIMIDENYEEWIFGVLSAIEEVLTSSEISVLRQLGKKARRQFEQTGDKAGVHSRILSIVGIFYKQRDLVKK